MFYSLLMSGLPVLLPFSVIVMKLVRVVSVGSTAVSGFLGLELSTPGPKALYTVCIGADFSALSNITPRWTNSGLAKLEEYLLLVL